MKNVILGDKTARKVLTHKHQIDQNQLVGVRLNLNIKKSTGVCVNTIHNGSEKMFMNFKMDPNNSSKGFYNGKVISYSDNVYLHNCFFNVHQGARFDIAMGKKSKYPMASVDGRLDNFSLVIEEDCQFIKFLPSSVSWKKEIFFNPKKHHLFVDENNHGIRWAEKVFVNGGRVFISGESLYHYNDFRTKMHKIAKSEVLFKQEEMDIPA